jgi:hypothetical protein
VTLLGRLHDLCRRVGVTQIARSPTLVRRQHGREMRDDVAEGRLAVVAVKYERVG